MNIDVELDRVNAPAVRATVLAPVFALALFTSAALLFWVQPLVAKMLLPLNPAKLLLGNDRAGALK